MFLIITNSSFSQLEVYIDTSKNESPNESWNVNKRYDKDGNITQYDSSYSYSYSSSGEYLNIDSLISKIERKDVDEIMDKLEEDILNSIVNNRLRHQGYSNNISLL